MLFRKWYQKLLYYGFCLNQWVWFHGLAGVTFVSLFLSNFYNNWNLKIPLLSTIKEFTCKFPAISVTLIAILWEFIEFFVECKGKWETVEDTHDRRSKARK